MRAPDELLYESESSLRLVDQAIEELGVDQAGEPDVATIDRVQYLVASVREELDALSDRLHIEGSSSKELAHVAMLLAYVRRRLSTATGDASVEP
jgi:hypothetical protein